MSQVRYGFSQGKQNLLKSQCKKHLKAVVKKTGTAQTNGVEVAKETENFA
jgi:hypothetical protein